MDKQKDNNRYENYKEERKMCIEGKYISAQQFDNAILYLSSGSLVLSLTFISEIVKSPDILTIWLLKTSWICFVLCVLFILISFVTSQFAFDKHIIILEEILYEKPQSKNHASTYTKILNYTSCIIFVIGLVLLTVFSWKNYQGQGGAEMVMKKEGGLIPQKQPAYNPSKIEKGLTPPVPLAKPPVPPAKPSVPKEPNKGK